MIFPLDCIEDDKTYVLVNLTSPVYQEVKENKMSGQFGYAGSILRVDLTKRNISTSPTSDYSERFLGGRGIAAVLGLIARAAIKPINHNRISSQVNTH